MASTTQEDSRVRKIRVQKNSMHTLGSKTVTHHDREHLLGCEEIQRVIHSGVSSQTLGQLTAHLQRTQWASPGRADSVKPGASFSCLQGCHLCLFSEKTFPKDSCDSDGKESSSNAGDTVSIPGLGKIPWRKKWQATPGFLPGKFHGHRSRDAESQTWLSNWKKLTRQGHGWGHHSKEAFGLVFFLEEQLVAQVERTLPVSTWKKIAHTAWGFQGL